MIKCPYCDSELILKQGFTGADWDCVAGEGSGYGWEISFNCSNEDCARIFPIVHTKGCYDVSVVKEKYRSFISYNL